MPIVNHKSLETVTQSVFMAHGCTSNAAKQVAKSLVLANLCGHDSHGVVRIAPYLTNIQRGILQPAAEFSVTHETESLVVADAQHGFGQVQMPALIAHLSTKARTQGIACGAMKRCGHIGQLSQWVESAAENGFAALLTVNDNGALQAVAPPGGKRPTLSTNPISIATPSDPDPILVDISTSVVANGKILVAHKENKQVPQGWLRDENGQPTTDPAVRYQDPPGSLNPAGGYKGFGLAFLLDVLVSGLTGGHCPPAPADAVPANNVLMVLWDPQHFQGIDHIVSEAVRLEQFTRESPLLDADSPIMLPHDRSRKTKSERRNAGIPLGDEVYLQITEFANQNDISLPPDWAC
ncbi:MAG: Ldh family oxidoreductase [Planctomycetaceae bacterium]|jgi:hydroxycarboxylate dehydrogenase B|nr:Ldh family oxidoreductase [Planctomycetaceae bacterium]